MDGSAASAQLLRNDRAGTSSSSSRGDWSGGGNGNASASPALYPLVWLLRGDVCGSRPLSQGDFSGGGGGSGRHTGAEWASQWVACNATLLPQPSAKVAERGTGPAGKQSRLASATDSSTSDSLAAWWRLDCWVTDASGAPLAARVRRAALVGGRGLVGDEATATCSPSVSGPR